ncbi:hypothetical protein RI129_012501 [Pyrocoelia pectoralis]|uniref:UDP-glucuronosyltransferase n=1 Tax=Pyrocoelia pectoralis TaxID=417401 RepID=A0AAN7V3X1_9COLE
MFVLLHLFVIISVTNGAKILGIVPTPSYSHQIVFQSLWRELSLRGHQVTTISTHPINDPKLTNLTEIDLSVFRDNSYIEKIMQESQLNIINQIREYYRNMINTIDRMLDHPEVKKLIHDKNEKFDLVIAEYFFTSVLAFAEKFDCPSIGMFSLDAWNAMHKMVGNPTHPTLYPDALLPFEGELSLAERVVSFIFYHMNTYLLDYMQNLQKELVEKHFGSQTSVQDLSQNISLLFINSDPIFHHVRPLVPSVIQVGGGFHKIPAKPLPKELKVKLDSATNGFIYFSLGSIARRDEFLSPGSIDVLMATFAELPYTVLWKFDEQLTNKPDNVILSKWFPQQDILKHPNIKLFITQGGLQSMDEAIYEHVPMIGIPFFGDQPFNVKKMVRKGFGLEIDYRSLEKETFKEAILEVINNPKYKETLKYLADLAQDQPMTGLEKAVWWSEYVIRHKGAKHLRSPLLDIPWYQYLLLDVIGVIALVVLVIVCLIYFILKSIVKLVKYIFWSKPKPKEKKN